MNAKMDRDLNDVFFDITNLNIKDTKTLKENTVLYNEFKESVYNFLNTEAVNKTIYRASAAYYDKCGCSDAYGTIQDCYCDENKGEKIRFEKEIGLKNGDLLHDYYLTLFTQTKTKGAHVDQDFFTILFNCYSPSDWTKILATSYRNWIKDLTKTTKSVDSLDRILYPDSESKVQDDVSSPSGEAGPSAEEECISSIMSSSMINSLAAKFLFSHPEDFVAINWSLINKRVKFKPKDLICYFKYCITKAEEKFKKDNEMDADKKDILKAACKKIMDKTLNDLMIAYGLDINYLYNKKIDCHKIMTVLETIYETKTMSRGEKETCYKLMARDVSKWYSHCKAFFSKNEVVADYYHSR